MNQNVSRIIGVSALLSPLLSLLAPKSPPVNIADYFEKKGVVVNEKYIKREIAKSFWGTDELGAKYFVSINCENNSLPEIYTVTDYFIHQRDAETADLIFNQGTNVSIYKVASHLKNVVDKFNEIGAIHADITYDKKDSSCFIRYIMPVIQNEKAGN